MSTQLINAKNLTANASIRDGFEMIAGIFGMIVTIVDDREMLLGIVTDGDLKKALLAGQSIDTELSEVMNSRPVVVMLESLNDQGIADQLSNSLRNNGVDPEDYGDRFGVPVVNQDRKVMGLTTLEILRSFVPGHDNELLLPHQKIHSGSPTVLVVGGGGYIGSILIEKLLARDWSVKVLDRFIYTRSVIKKFSEEKRLTIIEGDVCDLNIQVEAISKVDCVVFLAEIVGDPSCEFVPEVALKTNYLAVSSMATLCAHLHINRFVYTSSCSVYGATSDPNSLLDEGSVVNPVSHYARMKVASEKALFSQMSQLFSPTVLRLATVFGWSHRPRFDLVVNTFARDAYKKKYLTVYGGEQWRPNVHVADVAEAIIRVIEAPIDKVSRQVFNVGSNAANYTIEQLARLAAKANPECRVNIEKSAVDLRNYRVDFTKLKAELGYEPTTSVLQGLEELRNAFDTNVIGDLDSIEYSNIEFLKAYG